MIRVLFAFLILLAAVILGIQLNKDPGYVLIAINHWTIETTVWVAIFTLILLFMIVYLFLGICQKISLTPSKLTRWHARKRFRKAQAITRKGLIEYSEGNWVKAKNHLIQGLPNSDTPLLNYLTAARAAQKMGDNQLRDDYLREAQQSMPEAKIAVELTQAELQLSNHQWEQALATLKHLHTIAPRHPYVLMLMMRLYQEIRDWPQLITLLPDLKKYKVINQQEFEQIQYDTYLQRLRDLAKQNQSSAVNSFFQSIPKTIVNNPEVIAEYTRFLLKNNEFTTAKNLVYRTLRKDFNPRLIELYAMLPADEHQLTFAESLLKKKPHSAALYLCLGQLCIKLQLWGKAKYYLEKSNEIEPTPLAYEAKGTLHEKLGEEALACNSYKKGIELITKKII
ncbi:heme biosynthesis HemY N-terminal domain-containing protein [Legionella longbeachae]|uniref:Protoporphyrinogen IX and coproporphyrinogen III oxidase HemY n=1 Tax=Legionella longbeachae serogroup 1 (strain NSW150) TaxID=661367 RepID=D3HP37_LEGLN|nr:heme biosynthesis HemY N-terminal domain-containing protein [Legionella longbeachae]VEE01178.1 protoporphyrinogen oxidase [Legionella oakridgensis]HBD7398383.1 protoporphyrinogen oxidase [Legionella pneumophila]ARB92450.1 protoporphyrinogen oxidase [Legionella longbeachae]ARM34370.1 protoporphyrinogen oxidase [Legionella longbeachae]EEZ96348.1 protoporphyrinogen IX and coproporphyrinogen III oxidase HemY [Legionella longbeachae D-4968]